MFAWLGELLGAKDLSTTNLKQVNNVNHSWPQGLREICLNQDETGMIMLYGFGDVHHNAQKEENKDNAIKTMKATIATTTTTTTTTTTAISSLIDKISSLNRNDDIYVLCESWLNVSYPPGNSDISRFLLHCEQQTKLWNQNDSEMKHLSPDQIFTSPAFIRTIQFYRSPWLNVKLIPIDVRCSNELKHSHCFFNDLFMTLGERKNKTNIQTYIEKNYDFNLIVADPIKQIANLFQMNSVETVKTVKTVKTSQMLLYQSITKRKLMQFQLGLVAWTRTIFGWCLDKQKQKQDSEKQMLQVGSAIENGWLDFSNIMDFYALGIILDLSKMRNDESNNNDEKKENKCNHVSRTHIVVLAGFHHVQHLFHTLLPAFGLEHIKTFLPPTQSHSYKL